MGRAEVGGQHDAGRVVECEVGRRPAAGRGAGAGLVDQPGREERVDALRDGRAGEPGVPGQVGAGHRLAVADQAQHAPAPGRRGGPLRPGVIMAEVKQRRAKNDRSPMTVSSSDWK